MVIVTWLIGLIGLALTFASRQMSKPWKWLSRVAGLFLLAIPFVFIVLIGNSDM